MPHVPPYVPPARPASSAGGPRTRPAQATGARPARPAQPPRRQEPEDEGIRTPLFLIGFIIGAIITGLVLVFLPRLLS